MTQLEAIQRLSEAVSLLHRRHASGKYYSHDLGYNNVIDWTGDELDTPNVLYHDAWKMRNK